MPTEVLPIQPAWLDPQQPREGRYLLGPLLGQGGMGEVREAWDIVLRRTIALKILRAMDPVSLIRFMHEAQLQARVVHPNICQIYDVESSDGAPRIAMQLVRGATLADGAHLLSLAELIQIFAQVAQAMQAAHKFKLIHRDLKPSNILLERTAQGSWIPYVCDFGLAMIQDEPALTCNQGVKGTPAYMAPEQIRGERHLISPATDVYALGGTLFFALFGQVPLGGSMDLDTLMGKRSRPLALPKRAQEPLPRDLETILRKCLEPNPEWRYGSMAALAEDLQRLQAGVPIRARAVGPLEQGLAGLRQHRKPALLATAAVALLALGLGLFQRQLSARQARSAQWARQFALEAAELDKELGVERMLPIHDMRPAYAHLRLHLEALRARMAGLGADAQGAGRYALGSARFLLKDYAGAQQELEQAWALDSQGPEVAYLLARALVENQARLDVQTRYQTGLPSPARPRAGQRVATLFRQVRGLATAPNECARALLAFSQRDYRQAVAAAHASATTRPWQVEAATIEALSLHALGRQNAEAGHLQGAETNYREAMTAAQRFLSAGQSDEAAHHAYLLAGRGLAALQWHRGTLDLEALAKLQGHSQAALELDPEDPRLQDDWLALGLLRALRQADLGQDPGQTLAGGLAFLQTWGKAPLTPELRADRMLLHWQLAKRQFRRGGDPEPHLTRALEDLGHTPFLHRDFLGDVLNFKAEVEAARGQDPRPTLDATLARFQPIMERAPSWSLCETLGETWLLRATWEAAHGQDAGPSLLRAKTLVNQALQCQPSSAAAYALAGLAWALERQVVPGQAHLKTQIAREQLAASLAQGPSPRLQERLKRAI